VHGSYPAYLLPGLPVLAVGLGLGFPALQTAALHQVSERDAGLGSGVQTTVQALGGAIGNAVFLTVALRHAGARVAAGATPAAAAVSGFPVRVPALHWCWRSGPSRCWSWYGARRPGPRWPPGRRPGRRLPCLCGRFGARGWSGIGPWVRVSGIAVKKRSGHVNLGTAGGRRTGSGQASVLWWSLSDRTVVMMLRTVFLVLHIVAGAAALVVGPLVLLAARRRDGNRATLLTAYHWTVLGTCVTAVVVSVLAWERLWWLVPVSAVSYALVLVGYLAVQRGWPAWVRAHGLGGSYIALVTALLVVSARGVSTAAEIAAWILPAAIGVPLIVRTHTRPHATAY
jgi:hypothetical protein